MNRTEFLTYLGLGAGVAAYSSLAFSPLSHIIDKFNHSAWEDKIEQDFGVNVIGRLPSDKRLEWIHRILSHAREEMDYFDRQMEPCESIRFERTDLRDFRPINGSVNGGRSIFLADWSGRTLSHELAHVWMYEQGNKKGFKWYREFLDEWMQVADIKYGTLAKRVQGYLWNDGKDGVRHGCVSPYASTSPFEDIAETTEEAHVIKSRHKWYVEDRSNKPTPIVSDGRVAKKLELLAREEFISPKEYEIASKYIITKK